ncbi:MAG: fibronectin type III domain-containing protein [Candidatus Cloacimonetes bacterium]|nr:fibronectin type III domain-containing protein [Candidatus Cloacimonadota bacterium]
MANFFVQEVYDDSIMLSWTASADENFAGYRIYYSTEENVNETDAFWDSEDDPSLANAGAGISSTTITGLLSSTRYYFILQAIDEVGWISQYAQLITGMTTSSYPPMMPENLVLSVSGHDLLLNWDDVTTDTFSNPIEISYYEVHVSDEPYFDCSFDTLIDSMEESELLLEGVAEFAERLFFKVITVSGAIRLSK